MAARFDFASPAVIHAMPGRKLAVAALVAAFAVASAQARAQQYSPVMVQPDAAMSRFPAWSASPRLQVSEPVALCHLQEDDPSVLSTVPARMPGDVTRFVPQAAGGQDGGDQDAAPRIPGR